MKHFDKSVLVALAVGAAAGVGAVMILAPRDRLLPDFGGEPESKDICERAIYGE